MTGVQTCALPIWMIFFMIETKSNQFTPLPAEVLKKIIDDGNYVLEGKRESYYISYDEDESGRLDFGSVLLCNQDGEAGMTANAGTFGYRGEDIFLVNNEDRPCVFTLVKRIQTEVNVNDLL